MDAMKPTKKISSLSCKTRKKEKLKVVYISSPMKVKTSASKFRALVQELTGRHSDITRYDHHHGGYFHHAAAAPTTTTTTTNGDGKPVECTTTDQEGMLSSGSEESEYSFLDDIFRSEIMVDDRQFDQGMFPSYSLYDSCL